MEDLGDELDMDFGTAEQAAAYVGEDVIEIPNEEPVDRTEKQEEGSDVESDDGLETLLPEQLHYKQLLLLLLFFQV